MSFGTLFGVKKRIARDSSTTTATPPDPALLALVQKYILASSILDGSTVKSAKATVESIIKRAQSTGTVSYGGESGTVASFATLFTPSTINQSVQNISLLAPGQTANPSDLAIAIATNHAIPRSANLPPDMVKNITQAFGGKAVEREQGGQGKNPFNSSNPANVISQDQFQSMLAQAESEPAQTPAQKQAQAATLANIYTRWLQNGGYKPTVSSTGAPIPATDTPQNRKIFARLLKTPFASSSAVNIDQPYPWQNPYDTALQASQANAGTASQSVQSTACAGVVKNGQCITSAQDVANYVALLNQGLLPNTAMPSTGAGSDGGGASMDDPEPYPDLPTPESPPASSEQCGVNIFCDETHPQCCDLHGLGEMVEFDSQFGSRRVPWTMHRRKGLGFFGLGDDDSTFPISIQEAQQLVALILDIIKASNANALNATPGFIDSSKFSHADVVSADKFGKAISSIAIANQGLLKRLASISQGNSASTNPVAKYIFSDIPDLSATVSQLTQDVKAGYLQTPSTGSAGSGGVSQISIDENETSYADQTYYLKMVELQQALNAGVDAAVVSNLKLFNAAGAAKAFKEYFGKTGTTDYKIIETIYNGIKAAQKLSTEKPKKQSSATAPKNISPGSPAWNALFAANYPAIAASTPATNWATYAQAGSAALQQAEAQASAQQAAIQGSIGPVGGGVSVVDNTPYGPPDPTQQQTQPPTPTPDNSFQAGLDDLG